MNEDQLYTQISTGWYESAGEQEFKRDLLVALGIQDHRKADRLFQMAWDRGHSSGYYYYEVYQEAKELSELLRD